MDNEQNESIEAPEDDEFGDFEGPEDEAPEAVQAMIGGPNWVFPDLVRVQSTFPNINDVGQNGIDDSQRSSQADTSINTQINSCRNTGSASISRTSPRVLDPPDVSLLSSSTNSLSNQQNVIDLCSSVRSNCKLNFSSNSNALKNGASGTQGNTSAVNSVSSPSSSSSSSSSSVATNLSGLVLSNSSNSSSTSHGHLARNDIVASSSISNNCNNDSSTFVDFNNPTPSTSNNYHNSNSSSSTIGNSQRVNALEKELRTLQIQKALLQQQLLQRDNQIGDLQRSLSDVQSSTNNSLFDSQNIEQNIISRMNESLGQLQSNIETSLESLERRIERLETRMKPPPINGVFDNSNNIEPNCSKSLLSNVQNGNYSDTFVETFVDGIRREFESERREMFSLFSSILSSALTAIDNYKQTTKISKNGSTQSSSNNLNGTPK